VPWAGQYHFVIYNLVVSGQERPPLQAFEAFLAAGETSEAEREAVQQYLPLMQRCWDSDPQQRPCFKEARLRTAISFPFASGCSWRWDRNSSCL
jgi:hypothetical protein